METDYKIFEPLVGFKIKILESNQIEDGVAVLMVSKKTYKELEKKFKEQDENKGKGN